MPEYADSRNSLEAWYAEALKSNWYTPQAIKAQFRSASILKGGCVVFHIDANKDRLVTAIDYERQVCFIIFVGTHKQCE